MANGNPFAFLEQQPSATPYDRWRALLMAREGASPEMQAVLGPLEHGAYSEMRVRDRPFLGPVEQLLAIPGYTLAKRLGLMGGRSPAGLDEMAEGYRGLGRGLLGNLVALQALGRGAGPGAMP